ncbi:hypothetical protein Pmani_012242 [Petrolisthes manimaculis]|uniref:Serine/threonine-protein phosphatase CPPED1 n=1 Tax=Petrolisthes manimaculis TaxID=1843537 RepID=A0AAE1UF99_9EUCA|nr:hypothetical protein Pmani_015178 [Petrolisthes manimaculis]KAK4316624.1 hypothetical protein Pmani_012242 [Petrolisthes manimaculis]
MEKSGRKEFVITTNDQHYLPFHNPQQRTWDGPFYFIQAADTQPGLQERYVEGLKDPGWTKEVEWTRQMVKDINKMEPRPKFLVICGDLLDAYPETQAATRLLQEEDLKKELLSLEIPLVCVCGNHDVGDIPTPSTVASYRASFGDDFFSFWCGGVFFLVVNSQYYQDSTKVEILAAEQEAWLEHQLEQVVHQKPKHCVVFQHIPYFISSPEEDDEYFNLPKQLRDNLLSRLYKAGVRYIFCGHYHRNAGGHYLDMEEVVTSAVGAQLGPDTNGFRIVKVLHDKMEHTYYALGNAPTHIDLTQGTENN